TITWVGPLFFLGAFAFDGMVSRTWQRLPPVPKVSVEDGTRRGLSSIRLWNVVASNIKIEDSIREWFGTKNAFDKIRCCGCSIGSVDGCLYVLGGFCGAAALNCIWHYDPIVNCWSEVTPMSIARAYCKTSVSNNKLYAVGGATRGRGGLSPLQSAEVFDPCTCMWSEVPSMPYSKA
ncbi:F-box/kelch-repeat protein At1g22040-like, partial [Olea europaea var. sylvestris]|uniref:F-box/kelch-repeat protein At1g22040-like n=1 Tax=Olea europaea var. sylvestris TaxID=158386 RepID=UPI000C1D4587